MKECLAYWIREAKLTIFLVEILLIFHLECMEELEDA